MGASRRNERYLAAGEFPDSLVVEPDLAAALAGARDVLVVVPSHAFRVMLTEIAPLLAPEMRLAWATKGLELETGRLPHQIGARGVGICTRGCRAFRSDFRAGGGRGTSDGDDYRVIGRRLREGTRGRSFLGEFPCLHVD